MSAPGRLLSPLFLKEIVLALSLLELRGRMWNWPCGGDSAQIERLTGLQIEAAI
jgi:hypothetical protein